ncbi:MAG: sensor histidine kinase [Ignavibacteriales bacterium]
MIETPVAPQALAPVRDELADPRSEALLEAQRRALEMVLRGAPLPAVLAYLTQVVEEQAPKEVVAAILTLDADGRLWTGAAPSLPDEYNRAVDGLKAQAGLGTCSHAAVTNTVVITPDIDACPMWQPLKALPLGLGLKAAWSQPILSHDGQVLGTFGTYFRQRRAPTSLERRLVETLAHTAALAIEHKRSEEHQKLLINELNHRVKNTLATVQSIIVQTTRSAADLASARESILDRVQSLARAHDLLTTENWSGAHLAQVVDRALEPFQPTDQDRLRASGPAVRLDPRQALALSMAVHELATNAAKYGALSRPEGKVAVEWRVDEGVLGFRWSEEGGPPVTAPRQKGFGSRLLESGLAKELGGSTLLTYAPTGVVCEISAPL